MPTPPDPAHQTTADLAEQKARLEIAKLEAETRSLKRPNIAIWITALAGLLGIGVQYVRSDQEYRAAEIKKEKAELDLNRLEISRIRARAALDSIQGAQARAQQQLALAEAALGSAERQVGGLFPHDTVRRAAARDAIAQASRSVSDLDAALRHSAIVTAQARDSLSLIGGELGRSGIRPRSVTIVATIRIPYRADLAYRWSTPLGKVVNVGIVDSGETVLQLPHGGYIYFEARNILTSQVSHESADCTDGCLVIFF